jgi:hypothetical protein
VWPRAATPNSNDALVAPAGVSGFRSYVSGAAVFRPPMWSAPSAVIIYALRDMVYRVSMPVRRENRRFYRGEFSKIARKLKVAARWRCQQCGVPHLALIRRFGGREHIWSLASGLDASGGLWGPSRRVVLSCCHLNGVRTDNRPGNLVVLCQRCHRLLDGRRGGGGG